MTRIVIIDDDSFIRSDLAQHLQDWGYEVEAASNARHGFELISRLQPDLVLSDIHMPTETGFDLVEQLADLGPAYADINFLFVSSDKASDVVLRGLQCGADDFIPKPIDYQMLRTKIGTQLRRKHGILDKAQITGIAGSFVGSAMSGTMFAASLVGVGLAGLLALYWVKVALGINLFPELHLSDFL